MKETFYVFDPGESDVGISSSEAKITIEDTLIVDSDPEWIPDWKKTIGEMYDIMNTPGSYVLTEKEFQENVKAEEEFEKEMSKLNQEEEEEKTK